jgi:hypothetical protein
VFLESTVWGPRGGCRVNHFDFTVVEWDAIVAAVASARKAGVR